MILYINSYISITKLQWLESTFLMCKILKSYFRRPRKNFSRPCKYFRRPHKCFRRPRKNFRRPRKNFRRPSKIFTRNVEACQYIVIVTQDKLKEIASNSILVNKSSRFYQKYSTRRHLHAFSSKGA